MNQVLEGPKPISCTVNNGVRRTVFNIGELRYFVQNSDDAAAIVRDEKGNESLILVQPIRDFLAEHDRSHR